MDLSGSMQGAGGVGGLLAVSDGTASYYPTYDGNGNVSEYLDAANAVQAHYEYDAFGNTIVSTGAKVNDFAHRFSTKPLDAETGLYYYGYRYYDPVTGRWPSRDPIEERGGVNLYAFIGNDDINNFDYLGLCTSAGSCGEKGPCASCEKGKKLALADARVKKMIEYMKGKECQLPSVTCRCRKKGDKGGAFYDHSKKAITAICVSSAGYGYFMDQIIHEYQHASDACGGLVVTDCRKRACAEIRAYKVAQCSRETNANRKADCVRKNAIDSVKLGGCRNAANWVAGVWEKCYNSI